MLFRSDLFAPARLGTCGTSLAQQVGGEPVSPSPEKLSRTFDAYLYGRGALLEKFEATISVQLDRLQRSDSVGAPGMLQQLLLAYQTLREMRREEKGETPCPQS